jgi:hypothetical protein
LLSFRAGAQRRRGIPGHFEWMIPLQVFQNIDVVMPLCNRKHHWWEINSETFKVYFSQTLRVFLIIDAVIPLCNRNHRWCEINSETLRVFTGTCPALPSKELELFIMRGGLVPRSWRDPMPPIGCGHQKKLSFLTMIIPRCDSRSHHYGG